VGGVEQNESVHVVAVLPGEQPGEDASVRMADDDVRRLDAGAVQQILEVVQLL
jgi:hypothetical protein